MAKRTIICASPRAMGKCARVSKSLSSLLSQRFPDDEVAFIRLAELEIHYCVGCNTCKETGECFMEDGMQAVLDTLGSSDALYVVAPIYFSGPSANYKAMLDRLQPHYWLETRKKPKRPMTLIAIGDGGDPNGYEPLVGCTRSALVVAGFQLLGVHPYIARDSADIARSLSADLFGEEV